VSELDPFPLSGVLQTQTGNRLRSEKCRFCCKSLLGGDERKFLEPLMRFTRSDVRDHTVSSKIDHGPPYGVEKQRSGREVQRSLSRDFCGCSIFDFYNKIGTFRTSRNVRLWSEMRTKAEVAEDSEFMMGWTPCRRHRCAKVEVLSTT
jgi:hypothetical protein